MAFGCGRTMMSDGLAMPTANISLFSCWNFWSNHSLTCSCGSGYRRYKDTYSSREYIESPRSASNRASVHLQKIGFELGCWIKTSGCGVACWGCGRTVNQASNDYVGGRGGKYCAATSDGQISRPVFIPVSSNFNDTSFGRLNSEEDLPTVNFHVWWIRRHVFVIGCLLFFTSTLRVNTLTL